MIRYSATIVAVTVLLVGFGPSAGSAQPGSITAPRPPHERVSAAGRYLRRQPNVVYTLLYSFRGTTYEGANPVASMIFFKDTLYGTTSAGGGYGCGVGCGAIFKVRLLGNGRIKERMLFGFQGETDGGTPLGSLVVVNGSLFGTTEYGGPQCHPFSTSCGVAFSYDLSSGVETLVYGFAGGGVDGIAPKAGMTLLNDVLYGTTYSGGDGGCGGASAGCGTIFALNPSSGAENPIYSFQGGKDGEYPDADLTDVRGALYGSAQGAGTGCGGTGCGDVFKITTSGVFRILYYFQGGTDGESPGPGALNDANGVLYGTTVAGGGTGCGGSGCGTVFSLNPKTGMETILYRFQGGGDGATPEAGVIDVDGILYGTTFGGGGTSCNGGSGCGTIFSLDSASGVESILHSFQGGTDGANPAAGLTDVRGTLYGTTSTGGNCSWEAIGCGTVFSLLP
jgi:uncharacterized repeat protein (TIGR03803 family)